MVAQQPACVKPEVFIWNFRWIPFPLAKAGVGAYSGNMASKQKVVFIAPRLAAGGAVGGAETLLFNLAKLAQEGGCEVTFLTTCAKNHFTWANEEPAGELVHEGIRVVRFPVNADRDIEAFLRVQAPISAGETVSDADEDLWIRNNVNSDAMMDALRKMQFDRLVTGPYLFGLTMAAAEIAPERTLLVPCLHDEPFARVRRVAKLFRSVRGFLFNTEPERALAVRLFGEGIVSPGRPSGVCGFALPDFPSDPVAGRRRAGTKSPYILYCGRREPLKGTPLLVDYWTAYRRLNPGRDVKFVFTGSGEFERPKDFADDIIDCGFVSEREKHDLMAGATAFCHASVNESLSIVLLESWLARRPVLVHAAGVVLREQTRRANGGLWFRDWLEFAECLDTILDNPDLAGRLAENGRAFTLREYSPDTVRARLLAALAL